MSWFKRKPKIKEPVHQIPKHTSPAAEKHLKEIQRQQKPDKTNEKNK